MTKQSLKRFLAVGLVALLILSAFACCSKTLGNIPVHKSVYELAEKIDVATPEQGSVPANLYFDNTKSMYGYLCANTGVTSEFAIACDDLASIIKQYKKYSINTLADVNGVLKWKQTEDNSFGDFNTKAFYTYGRAGFDTENGQTGPLQSLFADKKSPVNFDELNVFVTDLSEQRLENKVLAEKINDVVLGKQDHSVALYCIESNYNGITYFPVSGRIINEQIDTDGQYYKGTKPFYCLIVGPSVEVVSICNEFDSFLDNSGFENGKDFNCVKVLSKRGIKYSPITSANTEIFDDLFVSDENKHNDYSTYTTGLGFDNTNLNFNVKAVNYDEIFEGVTEELPGLCYKFDNSISSLSKDTMDKASLNFLLPLSALADGSAGEKDEIDYEIPQDEEHIKIYGYRAKTDEELESEAAELTSAEGEETSQETVQEAGVWEEISYFDFFDKTNAYVEKLDKQIFYDGDELSRVSDYETNKNLELEEYPKENIKFYKVENKGGALAVNLRLDNLDELAEKYSMITMTFSIEASRNLSENLPKWIGKYNLTDKNSNPSREDLAKTVGLKEFYLRLIGNITSDTEKAEFESHMKKTISDVVVNLALS